MQSFLINAASVILGLYIFLESLDAARLMPNGDKLLRVAKYLAFLGAAFWIFISGIRATASPGMILCAVALALGLLHKTRDRIRPPIDRRVRQ